MSMNTQHKFVSLQCLLAGNGHKRYQLFSIITFLPCIQFGDSPTTAITNTDAVANGNTTPNTTVTIATAGNTNATTTAAGNTNANATTNTNAVAAGNTRHWPWQWHPSYCTLLWHVCSEDDWWGWLKPWLACLVSAEDAVKMSISWCLSPSMSQWPMLPSLSNTSSFLSRAWKQKIRLGKPIIYELPSKLHLSPIWPVNLSSKPLNISWLRSMTMGARENKANCWANGPRPPFCQCPLMTGILLAETVQRSILPVDFYTFPLSFWPPTGLEG